MQSTAMAKTSLSRFVLEKIDGVGNLFLEALLPSNRAEARLWRELLGLPMGYVFSPRNFSVILSKLKKQGLVSKRGKHRRSIWSLTLTGKRSLDDLKNFSEIEPPKADGIPRLVMFDIPESERKKRDSLRLGLAAANYSQLQKSVWLGYNPLPQSFIKFLDELKLKNKVHIVSINKPGTLGEV